MTLLNRIEDENFVIKHGWFDHIKWLVCLLKLICWSMSLMQLWLTKRKLLHNLLYMNINFIFTFYLLFCYLGIFDINIICEIFIIFRFTFFKEVFWKYINFWNIQKCFNLDMKISKFINYSTNMCWSCLCNCATLIKVFK